MNERIKELIEQSTERYLDWGGVNERTVFNKEKFAEMIVQECLLAISKTDVTLEEMPVMVKCHDQVEKHFGIE